MATSLYRALTADKPSEELAKEASDDINNSINQLNITVARIDTNTIFL